MSNWVLTSGPPAALCASQQQAGVGTHSQGGSEGVRVLRPLWRATTDIYKRICCIRMLSASKLTLHYCLSTAHTSRSRVALSYCTHALGYVCYSVRGRTSCLLMWHPTIIINRYVHTCIADDVTSLHLSTKQRFMVTQISSNMFLLLSTYLDTAYYTGLKS